MAPLHLFSTTILLAMKSNGRVLGNYFQLFWIQRMKINNIKHIFFDLDHTLWDFDRNSALTFDKIFRLHQMEVDMTRFLSIYEPVNLDYWKLYRNSEIDKDKLRYGRLKDTFDRMECVISDERIYLLSEDYMTHLTTFNHLFEHTIDILDYLKPNYGLHIITNG